MCLPVIVLREQLNFIISSVRTHTHAKQYTTLQGPRQENDAYRHNFSGKRACPLSLSTNLTYTHTIVIFHANETLLTEF